MGVSMSKTSISSTLTEPARPRMKVKPSVPTSGGEMIGIMVR